MLGHVFVFLWFSYFYPYFEPGFYFWFLENFVDTDNFDFKLLIHMIFYFLAYFYKFCFDFIIEGFYKAYMD